MYTAYFGFQEKPFTVTPDPRFFFPNPVHHEAYASLLYGIRERKGFIVLSGEVGTGKTTLLRRLMNNMEASVRFVFFYNTTLTFEEIVSFTCEDLGLSTKDGGRLSKIQALNEFLIEQLKKGGTGVLLIDEAQNLREEVLENLRLLSNLETASEKLIQIVLVGQPELETKLDQPSLRQLKQRIALRCRLDRLKDREVGPFIHYRLRAVGYERQDLFLPEAIQRVALYSKGIPRLINMICDNALLIAYAASRKTVSAEMIEEVASDLRLKEVEALQPSNDEPMPAAVSPLPPQVEDIQSPASEPAQAPVQRKPRRLGRVRVWTFLGLVLLGGTATITAPLLVRDRVSGLTLTIEEFLKRVRGHVTFSQPHVVSSETKQRAVSSPLGGEPVADLQTKSESQSALNPDGSPPAPAEQVEPRPASDLTKGDDSRTKWEANSPVLDSNPSAKKNAIVETKGETQGRIASPSQPLALTNKWKDQPVVIPYGATISEIVVQAYGDYNALAVDLIKEFNPHIENLNWVKAGERLWLPPLTRDTLLHRDKTDRYRLILASPEEIRAARTLRDTLLQRGYDAVIIPRRVSDNLTLYRVEIGGLKNLAAADQACHIATARCWISFDEDARQRGQE